MTAETYRRFLHLYQGATSGRWSRARVAEFADSHIRLPDGTPIQVSRLTDTHLRLIRAAAK